jgi:competence protein ComEC
LNFRPLFFAAVGFISGIALYEFIINAKLSEGVTLAGLCVCATLLLILCVDLALTKRFIGAVIFGAVLLGMVRMALAAPDTISKGEYTLTGTVAAVSDADAYTVTVKGASLDGLGLRYGVKLKTANDAAPLKVGDRIEARVTAKNPTRRFDSYDERLSLLSNSVSVTANSTELKVVSEHNYPVREYFLGIKTFLRERIYELFGDSSPIVAGFLLGDKTGIDEADTESFRTTGTAHLLTLSGFHVALLTAILFRILPKRYPWIRLAVVTLFLLCYCAVTAFSPSLLRASIMCFTMLLAESTEERRDSLSALGLAALVILLVSPYKLWSVGFRLSFAATFGIIAAVHTVSFKSDSKLISKLLGTVTATVGATAATMLIIAQYFGYFATYNLLANLTAVPVFSLAIVLSFAALLIGVPLPAVGALIARIPDMLIRFGMLVLGGISGLPYAQIETLRPSSLSTALMLILIFVVSPFVLRPPKKRLIFGSAVFCVFTLSLVSGII